MKIGIVLHPYGEKKPGGLPRIIFGWTQALLSVDQENEYLIFLKERPITPPDLPGKNWRLEILGSGHFWLERLRQKTPCDVYLFNTPVLPFLWKPPCSVVIALDYPYKYLETKSIREWLFRKFISWYHGRSLRRSSHVIAVSESTKRDTVRFFGIPSEKVSVVYHGFKKICELSEQRFDLPDDFFFFAGTMKERKNVLTIIKAFQIYLQSNSQASHRLVLGGKNEGPYYAKLVTFIADNALGDKVIFTGHLNEHQLSFAYQRAAALVFPSIVEGTGFPILEAMSCGVPVITSNIFGPAELGANGAAILINPYKPAEIAQAMKEVVFDKAVKKNLLVNAGHQIKKFSWEKAGWQTLEILKRISQKKFLVIPQLTRVGDLVAATAVFDAIKRSYPNCRLSVIASVHAAGIIRHNPDIDELIIYESARETGLIKTIWERNFDVGISLSGTAKSSLWMFLGGILLRIKLTRRNRPLAERLTDWTANGKEKYPHSTDLVAFYLTMLKLVGIPSARGEKKVVVTDEARNKVTDHLARNGISLKDAVIGFCVTTGYNKGKEWGIEKYARLMEKIAHEYRHTRFLVVGAKNDKATIASLKNFTQTPFVGATDFSLEELPALIERCAMVICGNTGVMHVADALKIPLVVINGPVDPKELVPRQSRFELVLPDPSVPPTIFAFKKAGLPALSRKALKHTAVKDVFEAFQTIFP